MSLGIFLYPQGKRLNLGIARKLASFIRHPDLEGPTLTQESMEADAGDSIRIPCSFIKGARAEPA
jgi:hypothetical protein